MASSSTALAQIQIPLTPRTSQLNRQVSSSSVKSKTALRQSPNQNPSYAKPRSRKSSSALSTSPDGDASAWGELFWVTLVDPQTQATFFACPSTGVVSWDPPAGNFVLPPSEDGEWWELSDESRDGLPYYYQTKTGETVWEKPAGFVIPLGIIQETALGRRLSQANFNRFSLLANDIGATPPNEARRSSDNGHDEQPRKSSRSSPNSKKYNNTTSSQDSHFGKLHTMGQQLPPIPGSPYVSDTSAPPSPKLNGKDTLPKTSVNGETSPRKSESSHSKSKSSTHRSPAPQSLTAAVEKLAVTTPQAHSDTSHGSPTSTGRSTTHLVIPERSTTPTKSPSRDLSASPRRPIPAVPAVNGKQIGRPILNSQATMTMNPVQDPVNGKPIRVEPSATNGRRMPTASAGTYPMLPHDLASDIQHFSESDYAKQYFSTHRTGFIFRRRIPVNEMMEWQKAPLHSPLLTLNRSLIKDAVKIFKVIQRIMGDRERDKPVGVRAPTDNHISMVASINSTGSPSLASNGLLEEERWLLGEGLIHGELRDEIFCQLMKQLSAANPNAESVFKGWQLMCVLLVTFPPSKNFETYLEAFMRQRTTQQEGRVDIMAKYCLRRLAYISKKGPRGKAPMIAEIETASDAAFNPSTFGESLDAIIRLQERTYPHQAVPIILPFLADGILALGGPKSEGIFRVPGEGDSVSELKLRIDRGYYALDGVDDPHVLASLMKLWLRELSSPLVPEEMYNDCITHAKDPQACVHIVQRLPTINRRVVLFIISFLQLFLEFQSVTKMTPVNLALVMAPNILRCNSDSMTVVFTNAQYEQTFVYNLLLHLKCNEIDSNYTPTHGLGATPVTNRRTRRT